MNNPMMATLPPPIAESWEWQTRAACRDLDPQMFFHPEHERGGARRGRTARAAQVCADCPVQRRCLDHSIAAEEHYGVWGGVDEVERRELIMERHRRRRRLDVASPCVARAVIASTRSPT